MAAETMERARLTHSTHPENRVEARPDASAEQPESDVRPIGLGRVLFGMAAAGFVGSLLTLMTVAHPLGAGDTTAALSMLPLALMLITIVNGWLAASLFLGSMKPK